MASPPPWLEELANAVALQMTPAEMMAPIGCHFCLVDSQWEITLFASKTEVVGGGQDGTLKSSKFSVDVKGITELFSNVENLHWQAVPMGSNDDLGAHLSLEGNYHGQAVWLRILSTAPKRYKAGRKALTYEMEWKEVW